MNIRQRLANWLDPRPDRELWSLIVKGGLRCAYDLRHAADDVWRAGLRTENEAMSTELSHAVHRRASVWLRVFNPNEGPKNYRHELHEEIDRLTALCLKHGIDPHDGDIPF